jgi:hypothetical protein
MRSPGGEICPRHHHWSHLFISSRAQPKRTITPLFFQLEPEPHIAMILALAQRPLIFPMLYLLVCSSL